MLLTLTVHIRRVQGDIIALLLVSAVSGDQWLQSQPEVGRAAFLTVQSSTSNNVSPHTLGLIHTTQKKSWFPLPFSLFGFFRTRYCLPSYNLFRNRLSLDLEKEYRYLDSYIREGKIN